jgi:hypothetical protein
MLAVCHARVLLQPMVQSKDAKVARGSIKGLQPHWVGSRQLHAMGNQLGATQQVRTCSIVGCMHLAELLLLLLKVQVMMCCMLDVLFNRSRLLVLRRIGHHAAGPCSAPIVVMAGWRSVSVVSADGCSAGSAPSSTDADVSVPGLAFVV